MSHRLTYTVPVNGRPERNRQQSDVQPFVIVSPKGSAMKNPGLPESLWSALDGGLWHATDINGLAGISADRRIRVSESDRYKNSFCRLRGCVSLFDFGTKALDQSDFEFSNWYGWLGNQHLGRCAVWLRIDRERASPCLIDPQAALGISRREKCHGTLFFVGVEACHKGDIPAEQILGALLVDCKNNSTFTRCEGLPDTLLAKTFADQLLPVPEGLGDRLDRVIRAQRKSNLSED
jgi:hypothetical protein